MISIITGTIKAVETNAVHVLTNSGLGYEIAMPLPSLHQMSLDETVTLWTALVVREEAQLLCGFLSKHERDTFQILIKISGVGLKMALAILSDLPPNELSLVVAEGDEGRLTNIAGVGKKTAQRLLIELNGKLVATPSNSTTDKSQEAEMALVSLGYKPKEVASAIKTAKGAGLQSTDELIRAGLKMLATY